MRDPQNFSTWFMPLAALNISMQQRAVQKQIDDQRRQAVAVACYNAAAAMHSDARAYRDDVSDLVDEVIDFLAEDDDA